MDEKIKPVRHYDVQQDDFVELTQEKFDEINAIACRDGIILAISRKMVAFEEKCRMKKFPFHTKYVSTLYKIYELAKQLECDAEMLECKVKENA